MAWKEVCNNQSPCKKETYYVECNRFHKKAEITGHYIGTKWTESDLQLTYRLSGYTCSILTENRENGICPFTEKCLAILPKYL